MSEARGGMAAMPEPQLEQALRDLAGRIDFPPTPAIAESVARRIADRPRGSWRFAIADLWPARLPIRRSLVLAVAALLLLVGAVIGLALGLPGLRIVPVSSLPPVATPAATTPGGAPGSGLGLGEPVTLPAARSAVRFTVLVPTAVGLSVPNAVYLGTPPASGRVELVYAIRPGLPAAGPTPVGLLITQFQGTTDEGLVKKMVDRSTTLELVTVAGERGYWISGEPHVILYEQPGTRDVQQEPGRLVGNVLIWTRGGIIYRIESALPKADVIRIAESMR